MTPAEGRARRDYLVSLVERETPGTRRVIAALPEDRKDWRPHPRGTAAVELAWHIVESEILLCEVFARASFAGLQYGDAPASVREVVEHHERHLPAALDRLRALTEDQLVTEVRLFGRTEPLASHLDFLPRHSIHHRGQLSAYLRAMGARVPGVYGMSADEREAAAARRKTT